MNSTSPKSSALAKLVLHSNRQKTFKVLVLGPTSVGKTGKEKKSKGLEVGNIPENLSIFFIAIIKTV